MANNMAEVLRWDQPVAGYSQATLGDTWWKTIYKIPTAQHFGLSDDHHDPNQWRGRRGSVEKALKAQFQDSVLFIGGAFGEISTGVGGEVTLERTIVLPNQGNAIVFFPLLNIALDNLINVVGDPNNVTGNLTIDQLKALAASYLNTTEQEGLVSDLFASIDGRSVANLLDYRQVSEGTFDYTTLYPTGNSLLSTIGYTDQSYLDNRDNLTSDEPDPRQLKDLATGKEVTIGPAVADGYWLAVSSAGGDHTLNFGGTFSVGDEPFFKLDITYNILNPIYGTPGKDNLNGSCGNDYMDGNYCSDKLMGLKGDDLMVGGNGNDLIDGGKGDDELWGDANTDTFVFKRGYGHDTIFDFSLCEKIEIPGLPISPSDGVSSVKLDSGIMATQIDFGKGDILTLVGIQKSDLTLQKGVITV